MDYFFCHLIQIRCLEFLVVSYEGSEDRDTGGAINGTNRNKYTEQIWTLQLETQMDFLDLDGWFSMDLPLSRIFL